MEDVKPGKNLEKKMKYMAGAFLISTILMGALWGFAAVDLSTDHFVPGKIGAMLQVDAVNRDGLALTVLGRQHDVSFQPLDRLAELAYGVRGFLPLSARWAELLSSEGAYAYGEYREELRQQEQTQWEWQSES